MCVMCRTLSIRIGANLQKIILITLHFVKYYVFLTNFASNYWLLV